MEYLKIEGEFPKLANCAVTMGKFDGIHRGHRKLVEKIRERKTLGEQAVLFAILLHAFFPVIKSSCFLNFKNGSGIPDKRCASCIA